MCFQPWLLALRREHSIAQAMAQALTPTLVAAYIECFLLTDYAPSREVLATALERRVLTSSGICAPGSAGDQSHRCKRLSGRHCTTGSSLGYSAG